MDKDEYWEGWNSFEQQTHDTNNSLAQAQLQKCKSWFENQLISNDSDSQGFIVTE